jgi:hypothetical protein
MTFRRLSNPRDQHLATAYLVSPARRSGKNRRSPFTLSIRTKADVAARHAWRPTGFVGEHSGAY